MSAELALAISLIWSVLLVLFAHWVNKHLERLQRQRRRKIRSELSAREVDELLTRKPKPIEPSDFQVTERGQALHMERMP